MRMSWIKMQAINNFSTVAHIGIECVTYFSKRITQMILVRTHTHTCIVSVL